MGSRARRIGRLLRLLLREMRGSAGHGHPGQHSRVGGGGQSLSQDAQGLSAAGSAHPKRHQPLLIILPAGGPSVLNSMQEAMEAYSDRPLKADDRVLIEAKIRSMLLDWLERGVLAGPLPTVRVSPRHLAFDRVYVGIGEITCEEITDVTGQAPTAYELARVNCALAGQPGHLNCGWCDRHHRPRWGCPCPKAEPVNA